jgi:hypothetical protein
MLAQHCISYPVLSYSLILFVGLGNKVLHHETAHDWITMVRLGPVCIYDTLSHWVALNLFLWDTTVQATQISCLSIR